MKGLVVGEGVGWVDCPATRAAAYMATVPGVPGPCVAILVGVDMPKTAAAQFAWEMVREDLPQVEYRSWGAVKVAMPDDDPHGLPLPTDTDRAMGRFAKSMLDASVGSPRRGDLRRVLLAVTPSDMRDAGDLLAWTDVLWIICRAAGVSGAAFATALLQFGKDCVENPAE